MNALSIKENEIMKNADKELQVIYFVLKNVHMCVDLSAVIKALPLVLTEPVPNSPNYVVGLMNLGGKSILIIDLAIRLGLQRNEPYLLDTPILLCSDGSQQCGVIVDKIVELCNINTDALQMSDAFKNSGLPFLGTIAHDSKLILLIDMHHVLQATMDFSKYEQLRIPNIKIDDKNQ